SSSGGAAGRRRARRLPPVRGWRTAKGMPSCSPMSMTLTTGGGARRDRAGASRLKRGGECGASRAGGGGALGCRARFEERVPDSVDVGHAALAEFLPHGVAVVGELQADPVGGVPGHEQADHAVQRMEESTYPPGYQAVRR